VGVLYSPPLSKKRIFGKIKNEKMEKKTITLTEHNVIDVYKHLVGIPSNNQLTDEDIELVKKRFFELVNYKPL
jgi:hypothetical protein